LITLSEEQVGRLLTGRHVEISVGEPWDFEGPDGPNTLRGRIVEVLPGVAGEPRSQRLKIEVTPFKTGGGSRLVRWLTASRRYADASGIIERVATGDDADANFSYADQVAREELPSGESPFLIGGVRLAD
jgi:hypothetical protein